MPVIHECAPASPAAQKWHMANPPGVQLHACKCHNLNCRQQIFVGRPWNTPISRIDGLVNSGVMSHFFRYMIHEYTWYKSKLSELQIKKLVNSSDFKHLPSKKFKERRNCSGSDTPSSWASVASVDGGFLEIHPTFLGRIPSWPIPRFTSLGGEVVFVIFVAPSHKNPCANDALALSKESSRALQPGGFSESLQDSTKGEMENSLQYSQLLRTGNLDTQ